MRRSLDSHRKKKTLTVKKAATWKKIKIKLLHLLQSPFRVVLTAHRRQEMVVFCIPLWKGTPEKGRGGSDGGGDQGVSKLSEKMSHVFFFVFVVVVIVVVAVVLINC